MLKVKQSHILLVIVAELSRNLRPSRHVVDSDRSELLDLVVEFEHEHLAHYEHHNESDNAEKNQHGYRRLEMSSYLHVKIIY